MKTYKNILSVLALIVMAVMALQENAIEGFLTFAFTQGIYTSDMQTFRRLLLEKAHRVAWNVPIWAAFYGYVGGKKNYFEPVSKFGAAVTTPKPTGAPFEIYEDFGPRKGDLMDIPIYYPLTGRPKFGSDTLKGKGEKPKLGNMQTAVNVVRHAYLAQDTKMSKQVVQSPAMRKQLFESANSYLSDYFNRWNAFQPYLTFLEGASENLTDANHGAGIQKVSHMNIYIAGSASGRVSFSTTHATYEAAVASALGGLTNTSSDFFSTEVIENAVYVASHNHRIQPIMVAGKKVYPMVVSDAALKQLQNDTKWNDRLLNAAERSLADNPLFQGKIEGIYARALILSDECVPSAYITGDSEYSDARSTTGDSAGVCYGTENTSSEPDFLENPVDPGNRKPFILFGKSAVGVGKAQEIDFEEELDDFKYRREVGADMIIGMKVADVIDADGYFAKAGNKRHENVSSLVGFTYSPSDADWS